jgi:hypothetical protein
MRRSPSPLRVTSSPSAETGVDVRRPRLRSAFLPHIIQEPGVSDLAFGYFPGSIDAPQGARSSDQLETCARSSAAPHPISEEEKTI